MRKRIFEIIEKGQDDDTVSKIYDMFMMACIILSLVPLVFKTEPQALILFDRVIAGIFLIDYFLRLMTADYKYNDFSIKSFVRYPFSIMAIMDIISILPSLIPINRAFRIVRIFRMFKAARAFRAFRALRIFRITKSARYSKSLAIIRNVLIESKEALASVGIFAIAYIFISALVIFNVEPDSFGNFFDAIYWATVSLTTVGYGDIYPTSAIGRTVAMISSFFGIAIVALPAGIITAGYIEEIQKKK